MLVIIPKSTCTYLAHRKGLKVMFEIRFQTRTAHKVVQLNYTLKTEITNIGSYEMTP